MNVASDREWWLSRLPKPAPADAAVASDISLTEVRAIVIATDGGHRSWLAFAADCSAIIDSSSSRKTFDCATFKRLAPWIPATFGVPFQCGCS